MMELERCPKHTDLRALLCDLALGAVGDDLDVSPLPGEPGAELLSQQAARLKAITTLRNAGCVLACVVQAEPRTSEVRDDFYAND
jgi:hypothetical protein